MITEGLKGRDFISLRDFTREEIDTMLDLGLQFKADFTMRRRHDDVLTLRTLFMMFFNASLRTRNSFEAGIFQFGGHAHFLQPEGSRLPTLEGEDIGYGSERISDMARVLSSMGDAIAIRILGDKVNWDYEKSGKIIREFAKWSQKPIINMEDNKDHPCQGMADLMTLRESFGYSFKGRKIGVAWTWGSSPKKPIAPHHDFMYVSSLYGADIVFSRPPEMRIDPEIEAAIKANCELYGGSYTVSENLDDAFVDADMIYAKNYVCLDMLPPVTTRNRSWTRWSSCSPSTRTGLPTRNAWLWPNRPPGICTACPASATPRSPTPSWMAKPASPAGTRRRTACTPRRV